MMYDHLSSASSDDSGVVFRDVITLALVGIVALVVILMLHINPPGKQSESALNPPGNVIIEITWGHELDIDVDLWVKAPGDVPVGYSNKGGRFFDLLRDDLGHTGDLSNVNLETAYTRGIPPGEYVVNVHLYRNKQKIYPVEVTVIARIKSDTNSSAKNLVTKVVKLNRKGAEVTAFRFKLQPDGTLINGSINTINQPLRSA